FWYFRTIAEFPHDRVYFTYTDALFFLADGLVLLAVVIWLTTKIASPPAIRNQRFAFSFLLFTSLFLLSSLSILWSRDWRTSLYISFHILLIFLFILSLRDWPQAWKSILFGFCAALSFQFIAGIVGFISQTTAFLTPLDLKWPGMLDPSIRGAVIVELPGGESFLRAYGTLPHPNILGGLVSILLLGPSTFFLRKEKPNNLALLLLIPGITLLALTFSRSAWLALTVFSAVLIWKSKHFDRKRLLILLAVIALSLVVTLFPYRELVQARTLNTTSHSEEFSLIGRAWLNGEATKMIREYPLTGIGIGSFILALAGRAGEGYVIEPAHNLPLLAGAELGIPGLLLVVALFISFLFRLFKTQSPGAILVGGTLMGLAVISLFDHYLWTLAPGRLMLGLVIGLFMGQDLSHDA
ncbi:MAG TPA: O-antigen ligase family protein, partial [Anaerolineales bacterium]|nr:O-antigen ligase family protein [Anaerolineales bacterium]